MRRATLLKSLECLIDMCFLAGAISFGVGMDKKNLNMQTVGFAGTLISFYAHYGVARAIEREEERERANQSYPPY